MHTHDSHHHHYHGGHHHHHAEGNLRVAFFLNLSFTIIEIIGGFFTGSIAILSDAIHDLGDTIAIGTAYFLEKKSYKGRDANYSYGYRRLSPFAALINLVILLSGSLVILFEAIPRLIAPEPVKSDYMILFAVLGLLFNGFAVLKLMKNDKSANTRTVMLHLLEDVLGWAAVLVGSIVIYFTGWIIIDPVMSILIASYILYNAAKNFKHILPIFLQGVPVSTNQNKIVGLLQKVDNVLEVHDLHAWTLDGEYNIVTVHLVVNDDLPSSEIIKLKNEARKILSNEHQEHYTLEIEFESEKCEFQDC